MTLLPCPFCGGSPKASGSTYNAQIECRNCRLRVEAYMTPDALAEKWNERGGKKGEFNDTMRLNRLLKKDSSTEIIVVVNKYGYESNGKPAAGNPVVIVEDRNDIDAVLRQEADRKKRMALKRGGILTPGRRLLP